MAIYPTSKDLMTGSDLEADMAQIYALLGDADHAIPILNRLLQIPCENVTLVRLLRRCCDSIRCGTNPQRSSFSGTGR